MTLALAALVLLSSGLDERKAAAEVLGRRLGEAANRFSFHLMVKDGGRDVFETESRSGRVIVRGSSAIAMCRGAYEVLRESGATLCGWPDFRISSPNRWPELPRRRVTCRFDAVVAPRPDKADGLTIWWDSSRWEAEVDALALLGLSVGLGAMLRPDGASGAYDDRIVAVARHVARLGASSTPALRYSVSFKEPLASVFDTLKSVPAEGVEVGGSLSGLGDAVHHLVGDVAWRYRDGRFDQWLSSYVGARYGAPNTKALAAWTTIAAAAPSPPFDRGSPPVSRLEVWYSACLGLVEAETELEAKDRVRSDLVDAVATYALSRVSSTSIGGRRQVLAHIDAILATRVERRYATWSALARALGEDRERRDALERALRRGMVDGTVGPLSGAFEAYHWPRAQAGLISEAAVAAFDTRWPSELAPIVAPPSRDEVEVARDVLDRMPP